MAQRIRFAVRAPLNMQDERIEEVTGLSSDGNLSISSTGDTSIDAGVANNRSNITINGATIDLNGDTALMIDTPSITAPTGENLNINAPTMFMMPTTFMDTVDLGNTEVRGLVVDLSTAPSEDTTYMVRPGDFITLGDSQWSWNGTSTTTTITYTQSSNTYSPALSTLPLAAWSTVGDGMGTSGTTDSRLPAPAAGMYLLGTATGWVNRTPAQVAADIVPNIANRAINLRQLEERVVASSVEVTVPGNAWFFDISNERWYFNRTDTDNTANPNNQSSTGGLTDRSLWYPIADGDAESTFQRVEQTGSITVQPHGGVVNFASGGFGGIYLNTSQNVYVISAANRNDFTTTQAGWVRVDQDNRLPTPTNGEVLIGNDTSTGWTNTTITSPNIINHSPQVIPVADGTPATTVRVTNNYSLPSASNRPILFNDLAVGGNIVLDRTASIALGFIVVDEGGNDIRLVTSPIENVSITFTYTQGFQDTRTWLFVDDVTVTYAADNSTVTLVFTEADWTRNDTQDVTSLNTLLGQNIGRPAPFTQFHISFGDAQHGVAPSHFIDSPLTVVNGLQVFYGNIQDAENEVATLRDVGEAVTFSLIGQTSADFTSGTLRTAFNAADPANNITRNIRITTADNTPDLGANNRGFNVAVGELLLFQRQATTSTVSGTDFFFGRVVEVTPVPDIGLDIDIRIVTISNTIRRGTTDVDYSSSNWTIQRASALTALETNRAASEGRITSDWLPYERSRGSEENRIVSNWLPFEEDRNMDSTSPDFQMPIDTSWLPIATSTDLGLVSGAGDIVIESDGALQLPNNVVTGISQSGNTTIFLQKGVAEADRISITTNDYTNVRTTGNAILQANPFNISYRPTQLRSIDRLPEAIDRDTSTDQVSINVTIGAGGLTFAPNVRTAPADLVTQLDEAYRLANAEGRTDLDTSRNGNNQTGAGALVEFTTTFDGSPEVLGLFFQPTTVPVISADGLTVTTPGVWEMNNGAIPSIPDPNNPGQVLGPTISETSTYIVTLWRAPIDVFNRNNRVPVSVGNEAGANIFINTITGKSLSAGDEWNVRQVPSVQNAILRSRYDDSTDYVETVITALYKRRDPFGTYMDVEVDVAYANTSGIPSNEYAPRSTGNFVSLHYANKILNPELYESGGRSGIVNVDGKNVSVRGALFDQTIPYTNPNTGDPEIQISSPIAGSGDGVTVTYTNGVNTDGTISTISKHADIPGIANNAARIARLEGGWWRISRKYAFSCSVWIICVARNGCV